MIAKLVAYGIDRKEAISRMIRAIDEYQITGIQTTLPFGTFVMQHESFTSGKFDTHFVKNYFTPEVLKHKVDDETNELARCRGRNLNIKSYKIRHRLFQ